MDFPPFALTFQDEEEEEEEDRWTRNVNKGVGSTSMLKSMETN